MVEQYAQQKIFKIRPDHFDDDVSEKHEVDIFNIKSVIIYCVRARTRERDRRDETKEQ